MASGRNHIWSSAAATGQRQELADSLAQQMGQDETAGGSRKRRPVGPVRLAHQEQVARVAVGTNVHDRDRLSKGAVDDRDLCWPGHPVFAASKGPVAHIEKTL